MTNISLTLGIFVIFWQSLSLPLFPQVFTEHANKLVEVANLACSMSDNEEGVKLVRVAASQIESLCPQVINAARILAARPRLEYARLEFSI